MQFTREEQIRRRLNWFIEARELGSVSRPFRPEDIDVIGHTLVVAFFKGIQFRLINFPRGDIAFHVYNHVIFLFVN